MRGDPYPSFEHPDVPGSLAAWQQGTFTHEEWRKLFHPGRQSAGIDVVLGVLKKGVDNLSPKVLEGAYLMGRRDVMDALVSNPNFGQQEADWLYQRATDDLEHVTQILEYTHTDDYTAQKGPSQQDPDASPAHKMNQKKIAERAYYTFRALMKRNNFPAPQNIRSRWLQESREAPRFRISPQTTPARPTQAMAQGLLFNSSTSQEELIQLFNTLAPDRHPLYAHLVEHPNRGHSLIQTCINHLDEENRPAYAAARLSFLLSEQEELLQNREVQGLIRQQGRAQQLARLIEANPELMISVMEEIAASRQEEVLKHLDDSIQEHLTRAQLKKMLSRLSPRLRRQAIRWVGRNPEKPPSPPASRQTSR